MKAKTRGEAMHGRYLIRPADIVADLERFRAWAIGAGWWKTAGSFDRLISEERIRRAREGAK